MLQDRRPLVVSVSVLRLAAVGGSVVLFPSASALFVNHAVGAILIHHLPDAAESADRCQFVVLGRSVVHLAGLERRRRGLGGSLSRAGAAVFGGLGRRRDNIGPERGHSPTSAPPLHRGSAPSPFSGAQRSPPRPVVFPTPPARAPAAPHNATGPALRGQTTPPAQFPFTRPPARAPATGNRHHYSQPPNQRRKLPSPKLLRRRCMRHPSPDLLRAVRRRRRVICALPLQGPAPPTMASHSSIPRSTSRPRPLPAPCCVGSSAELSFSACGCHQQVRVACSLDIQSDVQATVFGI